MFLELAGAFFALAFYDCGLANRGQTHHKPTQEEKEDIFHG